MRASSASTTKIQIKVGPRFRKDLGDIESLAKSIAEFGLLHPIVVDEDHSLIAGYRRLKACRELGMADEEIPIRIVPLRDIARGEFVENIVRKDFAPSEAWAIFDAIKSLEQAEANKRQGARTDLQPRANLAPGSFGKVRDKAARYTGWGHSTLAKIGQIVRAAEANEVYRPLVTEMDRTGRVNRAYLTYIQLAQAQQWSEQVKPDRQQQLDSGPVSPSDRIVYQQHGVTLIHGDCQDMRELADETVDLVITDPPFNLGIDYGKECDDRRSLEEYRDFTRAWLAESLRVLKPGGQLYAIMPLKWLPLWLPLVAGLKWWLIPWCRTMASLHREQTYISAWEPILWTIKGDRPATFHRAYQFEDDKDWVIGSSAIGEVERQPLRKFHPTPRPTWLMEYFLLRASEPGMVVLDPMIGSGTTAWAARRLGRQCVAYDINPDYLRLAGRWLDQAAVSPEEAPEGFSSYKQAELLVRWEAEESRRRGPAR